MTNNMKDEARSALDEMGIAERRLAAAAADCPPWRHAVFGLVMAASVATPAVAMPARLAVPALVFFAVLMIFQSDGRRTGMFVNGYRRGKTLGLTLGLLVVIMGLLMLSIRAGERGDGQQNDRPSVAARLRDITAVSDSVLSKHLSALAEAGHIKLSKAVAGGRQRTWASLTRAGRKAFVAHVAALEALVATAVG